MAKQFADECLAKPHDLPRALALRVEIGTTFATAHGQRGQRILERLLKSQKLQDGEIDRRVETNPALERPDHRRRLNPVAAIDLNISMIIDPGHAEHDDPLRLDQTIQQAMFRIARVLLDEWPDTFDDFSYRLQELRLTGVAQEMCIRDRYNARIHKGESVRAFPLSNWTELDIWLYIYREGIPVVPLYFAAERPVVERDGALILVDDERLPLRDGETPQLKKVRFRTLGCYCLLYTSRCV